MRSGSDRVKCTLPPPVLVRRTEQQGQGRGGKRKNGNSGGGDTNPHFSNIISIIQNFRSPGCTCQYHSRLSNTSPKYQMPSNSIQYHLMQYNIINFQYLTISNKKITRKTPRVIPECSHSDPREIPGSSQSDPRVITK